jgi:hypothetical protein
MKNYTCVLKFQCSLRSQSVRFNPETTALRGLSCALRNLPEQDVPEDEMDFHIIAWAGLSDRPGEIAACLAFSLARVAQFRMNKKFRISLEQLIHHLFDDTLPKYYTKTTLSEEGAHHP